MWSRWPVSHAGSTGNEDVLAAVGFEGAVGKATVEILELEASDVEQAEPLVLRSPPQ
jgi:hypothetical protein